MLDNAPLHYLPVFAFIVNSSIYGFYDKSVIVKFCNTKAFTNASKTAPVQVFVAQAGEIM